MADTTHATKPTVQPNATTRGPKKASNAADEVLNNKTD